MTSPELMQHQVQRWLDSQQTKAGASVVNTVFLKKEIVKLKEQEDRYNKAYGGGAFTIERLKDYTVPVREKITLYESQIFKAEQAQREMQSISLPETYEVAAFAKTASAALRDLNFETRKAIVGSVVERVVGTREKLQIHGFIPVTSETNVNVFTNDRYDGGTPRHEHRRKNKPTIPFFIQIDTNPQMEGDIKNN
jgi:site-specific DNA recombinase